MYKRQIYERACATGKRSQAVGGAKNHLVVMPDADMTLTADALMGAAYGAAGERCMAISVAVTIGDETADALIEKLVPRIKALRVGPGSDRQSEMGPLVSRPHRERVLGYINQGIAEGAQMLVDGRRCTVIDYPDGYWVGATLFDHVTPAMTNYKEEIFGPVLAIVRAPDYATAVQHVNDPQYGHGCLLFTTRCV